MILKSHLSGVAIVYEDNFTKDKDTKNNFFAPSQPVTGRVQGSLYSQQKRKIADACEYMRLNAIHKPLIFTATSPGFTDLANERQLIQKLTHNLRNGYDCKNYVWVREFTQAGYPHFHFVADIPDIDPVALSRYWSRLYNRSDTNSIRLGTAPKCNKCRSPLKKGSPCYRPKCTGKGTVKYYLDNKDMAFYMSKYIGKSIGGLEKMALDDMKQKKIKVEYYPDDDFYNESYIKNNSFRTFSVTPELARLSQASTFKSDMVPTIEKEVFTVSGYKKMWFNSRVWEEFKEGDPDFVGRKLIDEDLKKDYRFRYTGFSSTFIGYPKKWKFRKKKVDPIRQPKPEIICPF
jgi:hypothetical protein